VLELSEFKNIEADYRLAFIAVHGMDVDTHPSVRTLVKNTLVLRRKALIAALIENDTYLARNLESLLLSLENAND
jgi:hypothetical protein